MQIKRNILFVAVITIFLSCNRTEKISIEDSSFQKHYDNKENIPVVNGKVFNCTDEEIDNIKITYSVVTPFETRRMQIQKAASLEADGTFSLELDSPFPYQQIWLHVGDIFYAGIYANSDLYIELDADSMRQKRAYMYGPGVKYLGADGEMNKYLNKHILYKKQAKNDLKRSVRDIIRNQSLNEERFFELYDSLFDAVINIDEEFIRDNPSEYSWLIENEGKSEYYSNLCLRYRDSKSNSLPADLFDEIRNHKAFLTSNNGSIFYNYLFYLTESLSGAFAPINFSDFIGYSKLTNPLQQKIICVSNITDLKNAGQHYDTLKYQQLRNSLFDSLRDTILIYRTLKHVNYLDSLFHNGKSDLMKMKISNRDVVGQKQILEIQMKYNQTEWIHEILQTKYDENLDKVAMINRSLSSGKEFSSQLNIGKPLVEFPFGAHLYVVEDMEPLDLLANIKASYEGKAIILDFWATWCGPCIYDFPYSKKLHDQFKDEPIEFVYLCTSRGNSIDTWKAKIAGEELGGTHIFVEASIEAELMNIFSFAGFPSYAFIDANGKYHPGAISRMSTLSEETLQGLIKVN